MKIAKELLAEEDARIVVKSKRKAKEQEKSKGKQISVVKKAVEVEDEWDGRVLEEKKEEKGSGAKLVEERRSRKQKVRSCYLAIYLFRKIKLVRT